MYVYKTIISTHPEQANSLLTLLSLQFGAQSVKTLCGLEVWSPHLQSVIKVMVPLWVLLVQQSYFMKFLQGSNKFHISASFPTRWSEITLISDLDFLQSFANGWGVICGKLVAQRNQVRSGSRQWESMYGGLLPLDICCPNGNKIIPMPEFQAMPWRHWQGQHSTGSSLTTVRVVGESQWLLSLFFSSGKNKSNGLWGKD